ncbi:18793_t:CDS:2, partial [Gigaspora margarita]
CQTQYIWHGSTTNLVKHLRDVHHITKMSLEHSSTEDLKFSQQTIEATLSKPYSALKQRKLTREIITFFISCTLSLSLIENKNFHTLLNSFDPRYKPPCVNTIKNEIINGTKHTTQIIKHMLTQTNTVSLTFDLWTSRAHDSYLGVTCHWISDEFHIYDLILGVIEMGAYKTADDIINSIEPMLEEFGLEGSKILSITTDNGSNVKLAVTQLLARLLLSDPIANIFCAAHTLQLSVEAGLEVAHSLLIKCKALISLLSGEKKRKQLREAQVRVGILKVNIVDVITDVATRWNSTYMALERLTELERPIKWLTNDLENSDNNDYRRDGANIRDKLLSNEEFKVVQALVELLCPFDKATEILSGSNYATLSIMVPTIEELIYRLNHSNSNFDIVNEVKEEILSNLTSRWSLPHDYGMYASLLDPRFKNLSFCSYTLKQRTIEGLRNQFNELSESTSQVENDTSSSREGA